MANGAQSTPGAERLSKMGPDHQRRGRPSRPPTVGYRRWAGRFPPQMWVSARAPAVRGGAGIPPGQFGSVGVQGQFLRTADCGLRFVVTSLNWIG